MTLWQPKGLVQTGRHWRRPQTAAAAGIEPDDIAGLALWLRADLGTFSDAGITPVTADASSIGRWADQSANARHYNQATAGFKPTLKTGIVNSLPVIRFDGTDDQLTGPDFSSLTGAEAFLVVKIDADPPATDAQTGLWNFGSNVNLAHFPYTDSNIYDEFGSTERKSTGNPTLSLASAFRLYNVVTVAGEWTSFIDGTQHFTTATNTVGFLATTTLGANSPVFLDGDIAELFIYNAKLSGGDKASVEAYIATRYGLTIA